MSSSQPFDMPVRRITTALTFAAIVLAAGCGDDGAPDGGAGAVISGDPAEWCDDGQFPQAVAHDIDDGTIRWVSCTDGSAYRWVEAVTDDAVYVNASVQGPTGMETTALDPGDGTVLTDAPPPPPEPTRPIQQTPVPIEVDGYQVTGSQEGPTTGSDDSGLLWTQPGVWVYSDVWAIDDGAVFAVERAMGPGETTRLVAYEVPTGDIRWGHAGDPYAEGLWPWHAEDGRLYTAWGNVQSRDTGTGDVNWATDYPATNDVARFAGVAVDDESVYVGYATGPSGGD